MPSPQGHFRQPIRQPKWAVSQSVSLLRAIVRWSRLAQRASDLRLWEPPVGIEPTTYALRVRSSPCWLLPGWAVIACPSRDCGLMPLARLGSVSQRVSRTVEGYGEVYVGKV